MTVTAAAGSAAAIAAAPAWSRWTAAALEAPVVAEVPARCDADGRHEVSLAVNGSRLVCGVTSASTSQ